MKVNLLINNPGGIRSGYLNLDPNASGKDDRVKCDLAVLDLVDGNEASELVADGALDAYPGNKVDAILDVWISKLAHGGRIAITVIDFREVARAFLANTLSITDVNLLIHGELYTRNCSLTLSQLVKVLVSKQLKIITKRVENYSGVVVAERA